MKDIGHYYFLRNRATYIKILEHIEDHMYFCAMYTISDDEGKWNWFGDDCTGNGARNGITINPCLYKDKCNKTHHCAGVDGADLIEISKLEGMIRVGE